MRVSRHLPICLLTLAAVLPKGVAGAQTEVAVIAHQAVVEDSLSRTQLLDYFAGDLQEWPDGARVVVKDLKARGPVRNAFYAFLGKRPSRMKSIWLRRLLSGEGQPPEALKTEEEMVERVARTPGALGFVSRDRVTDAVKTLVLIVGEEGSVRED